MTKFIFLFLSYRVSQISQNNARIDSNVNLYKIFINNEMRFIRIMELIFGLIDFYTWQRRTCIIITN